MQKLTDLFIVPDIQQSAANINFTAPDGFKEVIWEIKDEEGRAVANGKAEGKPGDKISFTAIIPECKLWNINTPYLYALCFDDNMIKFGMRTIGVNGRDLLINGEKFFAKGYIRGREAHDHPNLQNLSLTEYYEKNIRAAKDYGFNLIRFHSRIPHEECFEVADRLGMMIHIEIRKYFGKYQKERATMVSDSGEMIDENEVVFTQGDVLFGSGEKLKRFANSLRLRVATRVKGSVQGAEAHIQDAISSGVMQSNDDNVGLSYENNLVNPSPLFNDFRTRSDFAISKTFVDLLKGNSGNFDLDPRLFKFATPRGTAKASILDGSAPESTNPADFSGMPYGIPSSLAPSQASSSNFFSKNILKPDYTEILMEYSEVQFLLAEANGWSQTNYVNGVRASMQRWGVATANIDTYIASLPAASKENVLTQKYITLFMQPYEAWAEYRRTCYPNTLLLPGQTGTLNVPYEGSTTYTFTSLIAGLTDLPTRLYYPTTSQSLNRVNYEAASAAIGGDKMNTKLIWDKN